MERRIHEVLDGERSRRELTPAERARLEEYEDAIEEVLLPMEREEGIDVTAPVMERIEALRAAEPSRSSTPGVLDALAAAWDFLWHPREVRLRPAWALAAGVAAALLVALPGGETPTVAPPGSAGPTTAGSAAPAGAPDTRTVLVQFRLEAPDAGTVQLAGDFTGWEPAHTMHEMAPGVWAVMVPLEPGIHDYAFVVDGEQWRPDPLAQPVDDGFGGTNSRLALMPPDPVGAS